MRAFYSILTPLFNSFLPIILMLNIITTYSIEATIAKILKAFTLILIVPDLNNSITVGSNKPYTKTRPNTKV